MSDLHEKLLAATSTLIVAEERTPEELAAVLRVVVELHAPRPCTGMVELCAHLDPHDVCTTCGPSGPYVIGDPGSTARCSTAQAIARGLGVDHGPY